MIFSPADGYRRSDLRAAALFVVDKERQSTGFDKTIEGSAGVPDVLYALEEVLATFPLESEVGDGIRSNAELPCWQAVLEAMEPIWPLWRTYGECPDRLMTTAEWQALRVVVAACVDRLGLWREEVEFPVTVVAGPRTARAASWDELERVDPDLLSSAKVTDRRGRRVELSGDPVAVRRVGLPTPLPS